jgi:hypothetical protein
MGGRCGLGLALSLLALASSARAAPEPRAAVHALVTTPFRVSGDAVGAVGLAGAAALGLVGDGVSLVDANRFTEPVLFGALSRLVRTAALGLSQGSTGALEGLRAEDVERLPEPRAAYLENAPGVGRVDTLLTAVGSLELALEDLFAGPAVAVLHGVGANGPARAVAGFARDERIRVLGPLVRESDAEPE